MYYTSPESQKCIVIIADPRGFGVVIRGIRNRIASVIHMSSKLGIGTYVCTQKDQEKNEPLGIECIETALSKAFGSNVEIRDLGKGPVDVAMVSANCYPEDLPSIIQEHPEAIILLGGAYPTTYYEEILNDFPLVIITIGEGENTNISLIEKVICCKEKGIQFSADVLFDVPNLAFKNGTYIINTSRCVKELPLFNCPTQRRLLTGVVEACGLARMETGRGCDWNNCTFCTVPKKYNMMGCRRYSLDRVKTEIAELSSKGVKEICLTDEEFIGRDTKYTEKLVDWIILSKAEGTINGDIRFMASISVAMCMMRQWNNGKNKILLRKMKAAGFDSCFIGIESGSETQLKRYKKGATPEKNREFLEFMRDIGINADIGFIMFDPLMTFDELEENIAFIRAAGLNKSTARVVKKMMLIPGTTYTKEYESRTGIRVNSYIDDDDIWMYLDHRVREVLHRIDIRRKQEDLLIQTEMRKGVDDGKDELLESRYVEFENLAKIVEEIADRNRGLTPVILKGAIA